MTKEYLLSQTLYGVGIMNYLIRKEFPKHRIFVRGDDCGENPDPVFADGSIITIEIEKTYMPGSKLPDRVAKFHYYDESLPDGDAIDLAHAYYLKRGEVMTTQELIDKLAAEMYINEPDYNPYHPTSVCIKQEEYQVPEPPKMPPAPKFSFFSADQYAIPDHAEKPRHKISSNTLSATMRNLTLSTCAQSKTTS